MPRKSKGRGRGRGRGAQTQSTEQQQQQVGKLAAATADLSLDEQEPQRPGSKGPATRHAPQETPVGPLPGPPQPKEQKELVLQPSEEHASPREQPERPQSKGHGKKGSQAKKQKSLPQETSAGPLPEPAKHQEQLVSQPSVKHALPQEPTQRPQGHGKKGGQTKKQGPVSAGPSLQEVIKAETQELPNTSQSQGVTQAAQPAPKQSGKEQGAIPKKSSPQAQTQGQGDKGTIQRQVPQNQRGSRDRPETAPSAKPSVPAAVPLEQKQAASQQPIVGPGSSIAADEKLARHKQANLELPKRPDYGTAGRKIRLRANFFEVTLPKRTEYLFHYDLTISPEMTNRGVCRDIVEVAVREYVKMFNGFKPAFDGRRNLYCRDRLNIKEAGEEVKITLPSQDGGKDRFFKLTVKYAGQVSISDLQKFLDGQFRGKLPQDAVQGLDIVLRQIPSLCYMPIGRCFFPPPNGSSYPLGGGCELWTGFYQSVRPSQWKTMLLNIDVSSKGFQKEMPVIEFLLETLNIRDARALDNVRWTMTTDQEKQFLTEIKGLKVEKTHIRGKQIVMGLSKSAATNYFKLEDGRQVSVQHYFKEVHRINLRYPHLPCLVVGQKKNSLPMELCKMIPTPRRRLTDQQTAAMIKKTAKPAPERQREINQWVEQLEQKSRTYLNDEYGMSINKNMVAIEGRVLPAPKLQLGGQGNNSQTTPRDGAWDMRGKKFYNGVKVDVWALICFADPKWCGQDKLKFFASQMEKVCKNEGMQMSGTPCVAKYARYANEVEKLIDEYIHKFPGLKLVVVALPDKGNKDVYKEVKRVGDTVIGIATQCVLMRQFTAAKDQVCSNIAMKINAKLGGTNHAISNEIKAPVFREPVIFFGADVTHPSPGENGIPSIAAVVASMDPNASLYCARVSTQTHFKNKAAQEIILGLAGMVKELLIEFYRKNKVKPRKIIFYRDGVSEGQFQQVLVEEVRAVQEACMSLEKGYQPLITFVVVQKRHHARLFCEDRKDESGKARNVPAGTTVDRHIVHPFEFDFYLCSHAGIQGTSRPAHYHVIYDDNSFTADSLQQLTYQLCHTFARCTRSVSMPAPAYYAHLAAFRARTLVVGGPPRAAAASESEENERLQEYLATIKVSKNMEGAMYFT